MERTLLAALLTLAACGSSSATPDGGPPERDGAAAGDGASADGGGAVVIASGRYLPRGLAADAEHVYWIDGVDAESRYAEGSVWRVARAGGDPELIAEHQDSIGEALVIDADAIYWTTAGGYRDASGTVMRWSKAGGAAVALASGEAQPLALALDGDHVYFAAHGTFLDNNAYRGDGSVRRVPRAGGAVEPLAVATKPVSIAVADVVYFAVAGALGGVRSVPKAGGDTEEAFAATRIWGLDGYLLADRDVGLSIVPLDGGDGVAVAGSAEAIVLGTAGASFLWQDGDLSAGDAIREGGGDGTSAIVHDGPVRASSAVRTEEGLYLSENPIGTHEARILRLP